MHPSQIPQKSELHRRWDAAVILQKVAARRIASALGMAFLPVAGKRSHVGYLVPPSVNGVPGEAVRMEVRVRQFPSTAHTSTLVERRVSDMLTGQRTAYCECFDDGLAVVYDWTSVERLIEWTDVDAEAVTVDKPGRTRRKVAKRCGFLPYSLGRMVRMGEEPNRDISAPSNDITVLPPTQVPLF